VSLLETKETFSMTCGASANRVAIINSVITRYLSFAKFIIIIICCQFVIHYLSVVIGHLANYDNVIMRELCWLGTRSSPAVAEGLTRWMNAEMKHRSKDWQVFDGQAIHYVAWKREWWAHH
jgi:hypothetical protein